MSPSSNRSAEVKSPALKAFVASGGEIANEKPVPSGCEESRPIKAETHWAAGLPAIVHGIQEHHGILSVQSRTSYVQSARASQVAFVIVITPLKSHYSDLPSLLEEVEVCHRTCSAD